MSDLRDDVRRLFSELTGREPDGVWSAPGRVVLPGGGVVAIDRRVLVAAGARTDDVLRIASAEAGEAAELTLASLPDALGRSGWADVALAAVAELGADLAAVPGVDLVIESNVPVDVGLGSSDAVAEAVGAALRGLWRLGAAPVALSPGTLDPESLAVVAVDTSGEPRDLDLAGDILLEQGAASAWPARGGTAMLALVPADVVSRVQVALDGGFAEHGAAAPDPHVVRPAAAGAARDA